MFHESLVRPGKGGGVQTWMLGFGPSSSLFPEQMNANYAIRIMVHFPVLARKNCSVWCGVDSQAESFNALYPAFELRAVCCLVPRKMSNLHLSHWYAVTAGNFLEFFKLRHLLGSVTSNNAES